MDVKLDTDSEKLQKIYYLVVMPNEIYPIAHVCNNIHFEKHITISTGDLQGANRLANVHHGETPRAMRQHLPKVVHGE